MCTAHFWNNNHQVVNIDRKRNNVYTFARKGKCRKHDNQIQLKLTMTKSHTVSESNHLTFLILSKCMRCNTWLHIPKSHLSSYFVLWYEYYYYIVILASVFGNPIFVQVWLLHTWFNCMIHHEIEPYKDNDNRCPNKYMRKCINI